MTRDPYRAPAEIAPEPTALEELLARARVRRATRARIPAEEPPPERTPLALMPDLLLVSLVAIPLFVFFCAALFLVRARAAPTRAERFCLAVPRGEAASSLVKRAEAHGFSVIHPTGSSKYVVMGEGGLSGGDYCRIQVSGGNVTSARYAGTRFP